jgi:hypothetical protein
MQYEIKFVTGQFEDLVATKSFQFGETNVSISKDTEVLFDGTMAEIAGVRTPMPRLRGAVKQGWLVRKADYEDYANRRSAQANIMIRPAINTSQSLTQPPTKSMMTTVQSDERVVMGHKDRGVVAQQRAMQVRTGGVVESQDGVPVRSLKTPAKMYTQVTDDSVGSAIRAADQVKIDPGEGVSEDDFLSRLSPEEAEEYHAKKEEKKWSGKKGLAASAQVDNRVVATIPKISHSQTREGVSTSPVTVTAGSTPVADLSGSTKKAVESVVYSEGIPFRTTNGPKSDTAPSTVTKAVSLDARLKIAKALCSDFPSDYSFDDHWKRRLARIQLQYIDRPDIIRAIFSAETDDFRNKLVEEFPEAFQG